MYNISCTLSYASCAVFFVFSWPGSLSPNEQGTPHSHTDTSHPHPHLNVAPQVTVRRAHAVDVTGLYVLSEAEGGESGDVADIMEGKRLKAEAAQLGASDDDSEDSDEDGDYAGARERTTLPPLRP